jgi:GYD domain
VGDGLPAPSYGDDDVFVIVDLPDTAAATGLSIALGRTGSFHVTTTVLLTAADMDAGAGKSPTYRPTGERGAFDDQPVG